MMDRKYSATWASGCSDRGSFPSAASRRRSAQAKFDIPGITGLTLHSRPERANSALRTAVRSTSGAIRRPAPTPLTFPAPGPTLIVPRRPRDRHPDSELPFNKCTSIIFPGHAVTASGGSAGLLTQEACPGGLAVTYSFTATNPGILHLLQRY